MTQTIFHRILHLAENPAHTQLLQHQLEIEVAGAEVRRAGDTEELRAALSEGRFDILVVDLPLSDPALDVAVAHVQAEHPRLNVLFRWETGGVWHYADASEPLSSIVRQTLQAEPARDQTAEERRHILDRLVRGQAALLRLTQTDFWDFEAGLRMLTSTVAELLAVERVSVWEIHHGRRRLHCLDLYQRSADLHSHPGDLGDYPRYMMALSSSLLLAAHDAREDPRTSEFKDEYLVPLGITSMLDAPIRSRGSVRGVVCLEHTGKQRVWDILEQCHVSAAATVLAQALELRDRRRTEERLREAEHMGSIGRLAARLAHDFNNRLTVIGCEAELALERSHADPKTWEVLFGELDKARNTARDLMNLDRERGAVPDPVDLVPILTDLRKTLQGLAAGAFTLELVTGTEPLPVAILPDDFESVVLNLVTNARDALADGGTLRVVLQAKADDDARAELVVEDDGPGMDERTRARLFEPFFTTKDRQRGSGLGLASVFAVVDEAGGSVAVESRPGAGTRIAVDLPLAHES
jgi:signal transduction histidine kinase